MCDTYEALWIEMWPTEMDKSRKSLLHYDIDKAMWIGIKKELQTIRGNDNYYFLIIKALS